MSEKNTIIGHKIKGFRESKNISIEEMAERSGLTVEQINAIESEQTLPSLGPLIKIARALGVRLGTFMDDSDALGPVVCRAADRESDTRYQFLERCFRCPQTHGVSPAGTTEGGSPHGAVCHRHQSR